MRSHTALKALLLLLALHALAVTAEAADGPLTLRREGDLLVVRSPTWRIALDPGNGGRIVSLVRDGVQMTRLDPDGHGGLIGEVHCADRRFSVVEERASRQRVDIRLACDAGDFRLEKHYIFRAERPSLLVRLTFENTSPFRLSGAAAPAIRNLALPGGDFATGRELYCLNRGGGVEVLSARECIKRLHEGVGGGVLRWLAVAEPISRRALGFSLLHGGCRPLPPLRREDGALITGWSYPPIPPGHKLSTAVTVTPLNGFAAVGELNELFVADSLPLNGTGGGARFTIMPLRRELQEVSVITRTYDEEGREMDPCDPLLFDRIEPLSRRGGTIRLPPALDGLAWMLHEVYAEGSMAARFAVPVGEADAPFPHDRPRLEQAPTVPAGGHAEPPRTPSPAAREAGFSVRRFIGPPGRPAPENIRLVMTPDEKRTAFVGVDALQDVGALRLAAAPEAEGLPASALELWEVHGDGPEPPWMGPVTSVRMSAGETRWFGVTVNSQGLASGEYAASLVFSAQNASRHMPLSVEVVEDPVGRRDGFGLWYAGPGDGWRAGGPSLAKLRAYGVEGLTVRPAETGSLPEEVTGSDFRLLAFSRGGVLAPVEPAPGRLLLAHPDALWLLRGGACAPATLRGARRTGYTLALLGERLTALKGAAVGEGKPPFLLVTDGCEPNRAGRMIAAGELPGQATLWCHLDLRDADWRRAAVEVRSALWAAAWQGLAGAAVHCPPPAQEVDRQLVIWHILRDARRDVALWRSVRRAARRLRNGRPSPDEALSARTLLLLEKLEGVVGPAEHCTLPLRRRRLAFRELYRVSSPSDAGWPDLPQFDAARRQVLKAAARLAPLLSDPVRRTLYWQDIPLVRNGRIDWVICAPEGEGPWKAGQKLQQTLRDISGAIVPLERSLPDLEGQDAPGLVWLIAETDPLEYVPPGLAPESPPAVERPIRLLELKGGSLLVMVRGAADVERTVGPLRTGVQSYPTAREAR